MKKWILLVLLLGLGVGISQAGKAPTVTKPYTFSDGTVASAAQVNAVLDVLYAWIQTYGASMDSGATTGAAMTAAEIIALFDSTTTDFSKATFLLEELIADTVRAENLVVGAGIRGVPTSFTITTDGTTIKVINGATGHVDTSGTDAADVIQFAIDSLSTGVVFIKAGTYDLTSDHLYFKTKSYITIMGEGIGATILLNGGIEKNNTTVAYGISIQDMTIDVNNVAGRNALNLGSNTYDCIVRRVEMKNTNNQFCFNWSTNSNLLVDNCRFINSGLTSAADHAAGTQIKNGQRTIFRNNLFLNTLGLGGGGLTTGVTGDLLVDGNTFIDSLDTKYAAVSIETSFGNCGNIEVVNNIAWSNSGKLGWGIGNSSTNTLGKVIVTGNKGYGINVYVADEAIVSNNISKGAYNHGIRMLNNKKINVTGNIICNTLKSGDPSWTTKGGINLSGNGYGVVSGNTVFDDQGTPTTPFGIGGETANPNTQVQIYDNMFLGTFTQSTVYGLASGVDFQRNYGYLLERNSVTLTAAKDSVNVSNTQATASSYVTITALDIPPLGHLYVKNRAAGSFTIKSTGDETVDLTVQYVILRP